MKKSTHILILLLMACQGYTSGQVMAANDAKQVERTSLPQEKFFIHYNSSLQFVGEYLYYSVYALNSATAKLSSFSKIGYVELVDEGLKTVFRHKVHLDNGQGQGEFFIPVTVPSGNYKLLGYTQWMRNAGLKYFFQEDIGIINPYQSNQSNLRIENDTLAATSFQNPIDNSATEANLKKPDHTNDKNDVLTIDGKNFGKRAKVNLSLTPAGFNLQGNYSLSVRRADFIQKPPRQTAEKFLATSSKWAGMLSKRAAETRYLPELRGELLSGKVVLKATGHAAANIEVVVSIPGSDNNELKVVTTTAEGRFQLSLDGGNNETEAIIQVLDKNRDSYSIEIDKTPTVDYTGLKFGQLALHPGMKDLIVDRSVQNQVENGYFSVKPDTLAPILPSPSLNYDLFYTYHLDDFKRFSTLRETVIEIIDNVWARKLDREHEVLHVAEYNYDFYLAPEFLALVLIDGVLVQDQNSLLDYNCRKIKNIHILRDKYVLGSHIFQGVVSIETIDGDYSPQLGENYIIRAELFRPLSKKKYFHQQYDSDSKEITDRLLDFRRQLLWLPDITLNAQEISIPFFTSDLPGVYEVALEGFTNSGAPVSVKKTIQVD